MLNYLWKLIKLLILASLIIAISITAFIQLAPVFGGTPDSASMQKIDSSEYFNGQIFNNLVPTILSTPSNEEVSIIDFISPPPHKNPSFPLPSKKFNKNNFQNNSFVWFGHSTILMKIAGLTVMTDPVFYSASPIPFLVKPFATKIKNEISDLPSIDIVLISHDHYDHLDYRTIQELDPRVGKYLVPLGVKAHLQRWGVDDKKVLEMDWYENELSGSLNITLTPSRHFSGRGLRNRFTTLWGSWVIQSDSTNVFFSGDSGYFDEFQKIGESYGPFDIAFMEDGAYNEAWSQIHMYPEQSVQASIDLNASTYFPIHWGKFDLSTHSWTDPIIRAKEAAKNLDTTVATPVIGEIFTSESFTQMQWWNSDE